jgi:hypothetical protein
LILALAAFAGRVIKLATIAVIVHSIHEWGVFKMIGRHIIRKLGLVGLIGYVASTSCLAQLQITEILYNSVNEGTWEWIEVRNTSGNPVNLDGYVLDDDDENALLAANISAVPSTNTTVPAGGVAVLYNGTALAFNEQRFRNAWNLSAGVPLIGVSGPPALSNSGDVIGLWPSFSAYGMDLGDPDMNGIFQVVQFTNSSATVDYGVGFPTATDASIYWNGSGAYNDGANWARSVNGMNGATTSVPTFLATSQINDTSDHGNPGLLAAGSLAPGLSITEIMYNPASLPDNAWEWIEVVNNSGNAIDFAADPHVFDDASTGVLTTENITSGVIPQGGVAILYDSVARTLQQMQDAWGAGLNYIPVTSWSDLNNAGDTIGIWNDLGVYQTDKNSMVFTNAVASVVYDNDPATMWPVDNNRASIHRSPPNADPNLGPSWKLSDGAIDGISRNANPVFQSMVPDHAGGDVGSPGVFGTMGVDGDFDNDGDYDCADIDALTADIAAGNNTATFDITGDGSVNLADRDAWLSQAGSNNLGAGRAYLLGDANLTGTVNGADFDVWNANRFTSQAAWCAGDFNADGAIDGADFGHWNANKGLSSAAASTVPEPVLGRLGVLVLAAFSCIRGGKH